MSGPILASRPFWLGVASALTGLCLIVMAASLWLS